MKIELPPLPYGDSDLAPHISANTISFHYGKHHKTYVDKAKGMVEGTEFADAELEDVTTLIPLRFDIEPLSAAFAALADETAPATEDSSS